MFKQLDDQFAPAENLKFNLPRGSFVILPPFDQLSDFKFTTLKLDQPAFLVVRALDVPEIEACNPLAAFY